MPTNAEPMQVSVERIAAIPFVSDLAALRGVHERRYTPLERTVQ